MGIVIFKCQKCGADLEAEQELSGTLIDCPKCKIPVDVPFKKMIARKKEAPPPPPPPPPAPIVPPKPAPPYPTWSVIMNAIGGISLLIAFNSIMSEKWIMALPFIGFGIPCLLAGFLIKIMCDILWHVSRMPKDQSNAI